jgi:hypothetical protein
MDKRKPSANISVKIILAKKMPSTARSLKSCFCLTEEIFAARSVLLRQDGFPICSDETGYYYADNQKEINTTVCRLNELVTKVSNARTGLLFASILGENNRPLRSRSK